MLAITNSISPLGLIPNPTTNPSFKLPLLNKTPNMLPPIVPKTAINKNTKLTPRFKNTELKSVFNPEDTKNNSRLKRELLVLIPTRLARFPAPRSHRDKGSQAWLPA